MAEAPKDRFRRLIKELSEDDRTFLDTNLLGVYRRGIDYGKVQGFFSESEARTYRGVADQRLQAIRKIPVLDQSGQPITKTVDVPIMRDGKQTTIKRTTPLNPFDLQKKTGGQMEGGALTGPIFTGRSLTGESGLQDVVAQRVKLKEQIAPAIQQDAQQIEQKRGLTALNKPGTILGLLRGAGSAPFVGASKDQRAAAMRAAGASAEQIARDVYTYKQPEIDDPYAVGVEHAGIFGQALEENVVPALFGTGAGILTGGAAATLAAPTAPFTAGLGPGAAALLVGMPTAYAVTELAQKQQQALKKAVLGEDVYAARQRQMQEATTANPYGAIAGQMAANFAIASPTLPSLSLLKGGLAAGKTGANIARAEQAMINAGIPAQAFRPQLPTTGLGGVVSNSKFYNLASGAMEGAITSKLGQSLRLNTTRGAIRGFTGSEQGREFISDIAERGIEGMTDFQQAMAQREKDKIAGRPETPLYQIMAQTLFGSLFEGRGPASKAFDFTGRVGQNLGTTALRAMGDTTSSDFVPLGRMAPVPSKKQPSLKATTVGATGVTSPTAPTATMPERMELPQNIVPMGRGRVAEINREGFTSNVKSVLDLPADYLDIRMSKGPGQVDMSENVYNAVSRLAPDSGTFSRVKEAFTGPAPLKAEKVGDAFEQLSGFTDDGFAKVNVIRPDGESTYNLVSLDMLSPSNRKKAEKVMTDSGITPASITGYTKSDVQRDIAKNFELRSTTDPSLKDNFKNEFWMGDTLVPGRIVSKVDDQHVVMQLPSPTSGVDMVIVPNVNVERMGQPQEILDTRTITPYNPSEFTVDKESYSPLRKDVDRISTKDLKHPMMLTPEQASRAGRSRQLIIDKKRELVAAGEDAKSINQKADASIKAATNEMLAKTRTPAEFAFDEGTLIEFRDASGQLKMGVVVDNTTYGPVVVDADAPTKPAFVVQESSIERTSVPMRNIPKTETETPPRTTEEAVSRRTGRKRKASTTATTVVPDVVAEAKTEVGVETPEKKTRRRRRTATPVVAESVIENVTPDAEAEVSTTRTRKATPTVTPEVTPPVVRPLPTPVTRKTRATSKRQIEALLKDGVVIDGVDVEFPKIPYETATLSEDIDPATGKRKFNKTRGNSVILDFSGRKLIVADINGVRIPFYLSTGYGGKKDVPPGRWYPVFGIDPMSGWFNKTSGSEITSYYGNPDLKAVSEHLDNTIGDVRDVQVPKVAYRLEGKVTPQIDFINRDVTPVTNERPETAQELRQNINDALAKVEEAVTEEVIEEPVVEAQVAPPVTPQAQPTPTPVTPVVPAPQTREMQPQDIISEGSFFTPTAEVELTPTQQTMVEEGDESATDEGSYLENVQPGDVTVAEGDSLVRVSASIEGIGDINEVLAKARNREELEVVLKDTLIRSGQITSDADATTTARAVSAYYDEMIHAFVNRDLYIAQLVMQGIDDITPVVRKTVAESGQPLAPSEVDANLNYAAKKVAWKRNRTAALIQKHDMPRINSIIESINDEASSRQTSLNELTGEYFVTKGTKFSDIRSEDTQRSIIDNVRLQLVRQRYKTNIPVFKVIDSGPRLDGVYDDIFEKRGGYTTVIDERTNAGQQVVFLMANNSDIGTTVHELSHAILDNMPVHMAAELATRFGKTLRKPTKLNESYIPWEMHEMFATAMEQSFLSGTPPTSIGGPASGQNRVNDIWGKISRFMQVAYAETYGYKDSKTNIDWKKNRLEWSIPYDNNLVNLWDKIPLTVKLGDKLVRAIVLKTDKYPKGPGLIPDSLINQPIVSVKFLDPVDGLIKTDSIADANAFGKADIRPADIVSVGGITDGMSANLGSMMVKWVSGYSTQTDTYGQRVSLIGLRDTYTDTNEQIIADNPQGLFDTIVTGDRSINKLIDKAIEEDKGGIDRTSSKWKGYLFGIGNRSMSAVNRALNYGLVTTLPTDTSYTNFNDWVNAIGSLRQGQFLKEYNYTDSSGKTVKKNALEWVQSGWRDLSNEIKSLEPYQGALELQGRERRAAAQRRSGNTGGNVLYQSRRRSADATLRKEAAQRIAGNSNPHSITPEAFAHYATYDGVPREVVSQFIDTRVGADALRTFDGTADIRTLEVDDVLIIDGTIDASGDTLASMKNAIDFAQRNGIDNFLMHTQAGKTEPLGYSDKGYSVEPTVTFTSPEVIADDIYSSVRREYPAIRISPDRKSVTMVHLEDRGKTYEESLENFGKAIEKVSSKFIEADVPIQGFQSTERVWNFGNESGRGYAIDYNEARNVLNLTAPHLFGVDDKPKFDLTVRPTIEGALSLVRGKTVNIPAKFDMSIAPDTLERWVEFGNQHSKLPSQYYPNTDSKRVYTALTKELPKQFKFLELSVGFIGSGKPSKVTVKQDARVDERNPMLADSGLTTVDGEPLKFSEVADAIYSSIRSSVGVVSGGEHSDNLAFAAHASLTQDPFAIWGLWSETIGRRANGQFSTSDIRRTGLPPLDTLKTGVVGIDKRIDTLYKDANNEFGHLGIKDSNNAYSPASFASGRGVTLFSSRKREAQSWYQNGGPAGRDFTTHQSPDTAIDSLFVSANNKDWTFSSDVIKQLSDRNSALIQMFGGNRDHAIQYLKEAVIANVSMTGNRNAGINALEELGVREDLTDTTFDTNESYVKKRIKPLKSFINPVDGKVKLYHASNNVIDIDTGGLVTANTLSRVNGNMDATLAGLSMLEPQTSNLGGTPSVTSMTYDIRYALDIARVANNFRNVLLDSSKIIDWRKSANDRIKTAILSYKEGDSYVSDRVRKMSGIDNPNVPSTYKSMLNEIANDNHSLDVLALTSAMLDSSNGYVRNGYEKAFADIDALMPIVSKVDSDAASNIQDVVTWMKSNQKPVKDKRDIDGVNPVYLVAYANLKAKRFSTTDINDMYDNTIEMLDSGKDIRREAIRVLGSIEDNHSSLGLPSAYMTDFSLKGIADMTPDELSKRSIGILEYDVSPSLLVEHNPDEVEVRSYAPSSFGTPSKVYTPDGKVTSNPTATTYKTLWSARPIKPPVRIQTVVDEDGTVTEVREEIPVEASDKVKKALKITEWVMTPYGIVNDLARNSVGGDWSSILIQNWMTANPIENPKLFGQQFMIGLKMMKPNLGFQKKDGTIINQDMMLGRQEFHELGDQIRSNTFYSLAKDAGLILNTARVDDRLAKLRETDPRATLMNVDELGMDKDLAPTHAFMKHGPLQGASERTMTMTKDYVKMMKFNQGIQHYIEIGYNPRSSKFIEVAKDYAGLLNVAQGDIKFTEDKDMDDLIGRNLRNLMFAPRWLSSRFMFDPMLRGVYTFLSPGKGTKLLEINRMYKKYGQIDPYVRAENTRLYMKSAAMFSFLGLLLSRFNPFGELAVETEVTGMGTVIRVGDYTFKAPGGALYHMELINTLVKGVDTRPGETSEERIEKTSDQLKMLIMSKAAPAISLVSDMVTGRNIIGEPSRETYKPLQTYWNQVTRPALQTVGLDMPPPRISNLVADRFFYLWAQDALDTYDAVSGRGGEYPGVEAGAVAALAFIGGRVRYAPKELKWQYRANDNENPVPGWEYTFSGVDGDAFFEEQARNVQ